MIYYQLSINGSGGNRLHCDWNGQTITALFMRQEVVKFFVKEVTPSNPYPVPHTYPPPPASQKPQTHTIAHAPPCGSRVGLRCFVPSISKRGFLGASVLTQARWYFSHPARANFLPQVHVMRSNKALWVFPHSFNRRIMKSCLF